MIDAVSGMGHSHAALFHSIAPLKRMPKKGLPDARLLLLSRNKNLACPILHCAIAGTISQLTEKAVTPSRNSFRRSSHIWVVIPLCAFGFLIWTNILRIRQVEYVSAIAEDPAGAVSTSAAWQPRLIVPEHANRSYEWLDQTRQMFVHREWRVRDVDYENAPFGRTVYATSPYRWWLGLVAWCDHVRTGQPLDQCVERAALVADPLLHLLLLTGTVIFVAWRFGVFPAALLSIGFVTLFPFGGEFIPGVPDDRGLAQAFGIWSVLPLLVGAGLLHSAAPETERRAQRWFFVAGIVGGLGLWINVFNLVPVLAGIGIGGLIAAWVARARATGNTSPVLGIAPWRAWALGGATTCLAAYLIEYFPAHLGVWELRVVHPIYGIAWLGAGELLTRGVTWIQRGKTGRSLRDLGVIFLAIIAVAALPIAMWRAHNQGFLETDPSLFRLTKLTGGAVATSFWGWLIHDGITLAAGVTVLPLLVIGPALWLLMNRRASLERRISIGIALGPVLVALGFACRQLSWWNGLDGVLLVLLGIVATTMQGATSSRLARWMGAGLAVLVMLPGLILLVPRTKSGATNVLNQSEVFALVERDLARWLAKHAGTAGTLILAPHNQTTTLYYYGGLRGLATFGWENREGLAAAMRIVSASTPEEAKELISRRGITHIVIPSWDSYLDVYTQMGMGRLEGTFMNLLHQWKLPLWLRPIPYQLPVIAGFEGQSVTIFEVVGEEQDDATQLSRIAEYFVEMGQLDVAASVAQGLRRFPANLGALVARAQVELVRGDTAAFARSVEQLRSRLSNKGDRGLPWDQRVSLAVVLMRGKEPDLARVQVQRCLAEVDEAKLRSLSIGSLYRLQVLAKAYGLTIANSPLHDLALDLLPPDMQDRLR
jgi:hypothetical protein